jgi:hypothetical protein
MAKSHYHLCLAHLVHQYPSYREFYAKRSRLGNFVILDNSAHEHGRGEPGEVLASAAQAIHPSEIVLPDVLFDSAGTVELSRKALPQLVSLAPLMVVPQGRNFDEWKWCLDQLLPLGPQTIGISKDFEVWSSQGLVPLIEFSLQFEKPLHLLGWGRKLHLLPDYIAAGEGFIRGIDSAKPAVYAYAGIALPKDLSQAPAYPGRPEKFFALEPQDFDIRVLEHNLRVFEALASSREDEI